MHDFDFSLALEISLLVLLELVERHLVFTEDDGDIGFNAVFNGVSSNEQDYETFSLACRNFQVRQSVAIFEGHRRNVELVEVRLEFTIRFLFELLRDYYELVDNTLCLSRVNQFLGFFVDLGLIDKAMRTGALFSFDG